MYVPEAFKEDQPEKIFDFIRRYSFGVLSSGENGKLLASHLPFLVDEKAGSRGTLISHMAKANSHWKGLEGKEVLVVFQGPHAYISPTWYGAVEVVPTWNYAAVHVYGKYVPLTGDGEIREILEKMVNFYEAPMPQPWDIQTLPKEYFEKLQKMIVGFKVEITRFEGKWKLSQNHSEERRAKVIQTLEQGGTRAQEVAELMRQEEKK